jgi:hypothetical protein
MQTTPPTKAKRAYRKKRLLTQDELWKLIIPILWSDFLQYYLPEWEEDIDFSRTPEFLDKDLKRLMPKGKSKNRAVDILMRVYMKDGTTKAFLLHIEVQAYFDPLFTKRLYQYYYRISDLLQEPIETLVIMIDEDPNYRPSEYREQFGQTSVHFKFRLFKLLDNPPPYPEGNVFSIVLEVAWHALKQNQLKNDDDLETLKFKLIRKLLEKNIPNEKIYAVLEFINIYLPFTNPEKERIFDKKLDELIFKDDIMEVISIKDYIIKKIETQTERKFRKQVKEAKNEATEAKNEATEAKNEATEAKNVISNTILNLHAKGYSPEAIADIMSKPLPFIIDIIEKNKA